MLFRGNRGSGDMNLDSEIARCGSEQPLGERERKMLAPVSEGPLPEDLEASKRRRMRDRGSWGSVWQKTSSHFFGSKRSDLRMLLGVLGAPLAPFPIQYKDVLCVASPKENDIETSSAQYIMQHYVAATGGAKLQSAVQNFFAAGKLRMIASEYDTANKLVRPRSAAKAAEVGWFNLWQSGQSLWLLDVELKADGDKVHVSAGCDGKLVWRHTPWLGAHASKGPIRPLRRALQGLDPRTTAIVFAASRCVGEKKVEEEDCFILKVSTDADTLSARSAGPAEILRHVLYGYFSQKTGLLVRLEDSHLTRIQNYGEETVYWETSIESTLQDYRCVDGVLIAHAGKSVVTLFRFGEVAMSQVKTRLEEEWTISEVALNVQGVSGETFLPPADIRATPSNEKRELHSADRGKRWRGHAFVNAHEKPLDDDTVIWRVEV